MDITINFWGVLLGAISSLVVGAIYYSPGLFGKDWMKLGKVDEKRFKKEQPKFTVLALVVAFIVAYFVAYFGFLYHNFYQDSWLGAAVSVALLLWVGFSATTVVVHGALDQRPRRLMYITLGNRLLSFLAIGLLVGWLHP